MNEEMNLVRDLAVILISAGAFTIISKALKQPLVLGYIVAGFLIGPYIDFFPGISSKEAVEQWSEIGIIFMMFGLGLEFSFRKLLKVGSGAIVTAGAKFLGVFVLGFVTGQAMGWTNMESIFLGGLLSMSSTAVVLKSYEDMGLKKKPYAGMVFGTLVVEDLIAILLMVLLSTMAVSNKFEGKEMVQNIVKLVFFLILWFLVGIYVIPSILKKARSYITDEILLIVSVGLCFGMVALATGVGFSSALGAFVMGSILAETIESEHIVKIVTPIKDLFGAIFFVSVGMMVSPTAIIENWLVILILTLFVIITHIVFSAMGIILTGGGLENGTKVGFSLAQLGEFGFIIVGVGVSLGVMRDFIYPVIIAVSVITTFTTPYMIKLADPAYNWLSKHLPEKMLERLQPEEQEGRVTAAEQSEWKKLLKAYFARIFFYGIILVGINIVSRYYLDPLITKLLPELSKAHHDIFSIAITLLAMAPFLYGLGVNSGSINVYAPKLMKAKKSNRWPILGLVIARSFIAVGAVLSVIAERFTLAGWTILFIVAAGIIFIFVARANFHKSTFLEKRFFDNLNEKQEAEKKRKPVATSIHKEMAGYDVHIEKIRVAPECSLVGEKMKDIPFRSQSGANIILIRRGKINITIPSGDVRIYPHDHLLAVGTTEQLKALRTMVEASISTEASEDTELDFSVVSIQLDENSYLTGQLLRETGMRDYRCMVISVLHKEQFITNPKPDYRFEAGDVVWIAGETSSCDWLNDQKED